MGLIDKTLEEMLDEIGSAQLIREDTILLSKIRCDETSANDRFIKYSNYIRKVLVPIERALTQLTKKPFYAEPSFTFAVECAIENAIERGNSDDPNLQTSIKYYIGERGVVAQIKDEGAGFDYEDIQQKFLAKVPYAKRTGTGFRMYNQVPDLSFSFENGGNTINLMYTPPQEIVDVIKQAIPRKT